MNASSIVSRATTSSSSRSGYGWSHGRSSGGGIGAVGSTGSETSGGRTRAGRRRSVSRHALVAIRYSHARSSKRPSALNFARLRHARRKVSWT